mgnify:CR=1 FL=1
MQELGGQMYQNAEGDAAAPDAEGDAMGDDEDVVDAEFTEN